MRPKLMHLGSFFRRHPHSWQPACVHVPALCHSSFCDTLLCSPLIYKAGLTAHPLCLTALTSECLQGANAGWILTAVVINFYTNLYYQTRMVLQSFVVLLQIQGEGGHARG